MVIHIYNGASCLFIVAMCHFGFELYSCMLYFRIQKQDARNAYAWVFQWACYREVVLVKSRMNVAKLFYGRIELCLGNYV